MSEEYYKAMRTVEYGHLDFRRIMYTGLDITEDRKDILDMPCYECGHRMKRYQI